MTCTRCGGTGFLDYEQLPDDVLIQFDKHGCDWLLDWLTKNGEDYDTQVCDCCGDGEGWYGEPGEHYNSDDPPGNNGPYQYNGGLCECH